MTTHFSAPDPEAVAYSPQSQRRADRAAKCSPFRLKLFQTLRSQSVSLQELTDSTGIHNGYTLTPLGELAVENELLWLLAVGLLRREVDGQGLTDSFRLTPLGRQLLDRWQVSRTADLKPNFQDHLYNSLSRWLRLPGWLQS
ncbi:MAG: Npun_F0494 family protein [Leptolyngbyaceae cyanobacterium]